MTAPTVDDQLDQEGGSVPAATNAGTDRPRPAAGTTTTPSSATTPGTLTSTASGELPTNSVSASASPTSRSSVGRSTASTPSWRVPHSVRQFAAQTNLVATMVLRDEIDLERARIYSGLARTVAQAMSTEVSRARFLAEEPDLSLEDES